MKIKKTFIQKLIKEEIRKVLYGDPIKQDVINLFAKARDAMDDPANKTEHTKELINSLESIGVVPNMAIDHLLDSEEIDQNFYIRCAEIHNEIVKITGGEEKRINAFAHFPKMDRSPEHSPKFQKPKSLSAFDQLDTRKDRKNLVHENKKFLFIKNLILESINESKKEELKSKFPELADKIDFLSSNGIVGSELQWATNQLSNNDAKDVLKNIQEFIKNKPKLKIKDINQYKTLEDLKTSLGNRELTGKEKEKKEKSSAQTFFSDENFAMIRPRSTNSSCYYGSNTKWCISANEGNRFAEYSRQDSKFYFIINKKSKDKKYAKIAYSILPIKNVSKIYLLKIDKSKDFIDGETIVQIHDSSNKRMSRDDVSKIIGAELENKLFSMMINDYKTGIPSISLTDEDEQDVINKIQNIIKSYNERNFEQLNKDVVEVDKFLRDIYGTKDYNKIMDKIIPYAKQNRILRTKFYMLMPSELSQIGYEELQKIHEDAYKNVKFARQNIKQDNLEKAKLNIEKAMLYFFESGRTFPYQGIKSQIYPSIENLIKDPTNEEIKQKILMNIKSILS